MENTPRLSGLVLIKYDPVWGADSSALGFRSWPLQDVTVLHRRGFAEPLHQQTESEHPAGPSFKLTPLPGNQIFFFFSNSMSSLLH